MSLSGNPPKQEHFPKHKQPQVQQQHREEKTNTFFKLQQRYDNNLLLPPTYSRRPYTTIITPLSYSLGVHLYFIEGVLPHHLVPQLPLRIVPGLPLHEERRLFAEGLSQGVHVSLGGGGALPGRHDVLLVGHVEWVRDDVVVEREEQRDVAHVVQERDLQHRVGEICQQKIPNIYFSFV